MIREGLFYNFKEIETIAKKNGIVPQSVKEVLGCLVGDRVVIQEKIGSLNMYSSLFSPRICTRRFWAFASNEIACLENQIKDAESTVRYDSFSVSLWLVGVAGGAHPEFDCVEYLDEGEVSKSYGARFDETQQRVIRPRIKERRTGKAPHGPLEKRPRNDCTP